MYIHILKIIFSILCCDIWFYISHLILHHEYFYKYHKKHHKKINPNFLDTYTGHFLEGPFQSLGFLLCVILIKYTIIERISALILINLRGMLRHDERGVFLIGNHHLLHHTYPKYNYGEYWLDCICGTKYPHDEEYKKGLIYI
jgi:sterol desaturase/sphingolipid hydroxylase (fatty acid hydroxylase superfamily)